MPVKPRRNEDKFEMNNVKEQPLAEVQERKNEILAPSDRTAFIKLVIDISEHIFSCGGEVSRVEETVHRICTAYGAKKTDVFCITSVVIVTTIWEDGEIITQTRRTAQGSRNFRKLEMLNRLSRSVCAQTPSVSEIEERLSEILRQKYTSKRLACLGSVFAAGGFAVFFGGNLIDACAAAICGVIIFLIEQFVYRSKMNKIVYHIVCSFITGITAVLLVKLGIGKSLDKIMIGCIMLLIPGINLTAAVEDVLLGDTATGALKLFEAALLACAIAFGFALAVFVFKGGDVI